MTDSLSDQKRRSSRAAWKRAAEQPVTTPDSVPDLVTGPNGKFINVTGLTLHTAMMVEDVGQWMDLNARLRRKPDGSVEVVLLTLRRVPE